MRVIPIFGKTHRKKHRVTEYFYLYFFLNTLLLLPLNVIDAGLIIMIKVARHQLKTESICIKFTSVVLWLSEKNI